MNYSSSSDFFFQSIKNIKTILSSEAIKTQAVGWMWAAGRGLLTPVLRGRQSAWGEITGKRSMAYFLLKFGVEDDGKRSILY